MYINRHILPYLERMKNQFRVLLVTGSRQVGKSTLLKNKLLPEYDYVTLDDFSDLSIAQKDASLFFKNHPLPVIVDEVQCAPNLFLQIKLLADNSEEKGKIILTGYRYRPCLPFSWLEFKSGCNERCNVRQLV